MPVDYICRIKDSCNKAWVRGVMTVVKPFLGMEMLGEENIEHRYMGLLPLSHVFGLIAGTLGCFYTGNLLFTCEDMKASIGQMPKTKPTLLVIVPGICDILEC